MLDGLAGDALAAFSDDDAPPDCDCRPVDDRAPAPVLGVGEGSGGRLDVDATACPGGGRLVTAPACRATVVRALADREVRAVRTHAAGVERVYEDVSLLVAAARFARTIRGVDGALADRAERDPLGAATRAAGRSGAPARAAAEAGLLVAAEAVDGYGGALRPLVGPAISRSLVARGPPPDARLADRRELDTGAVVLIYDRVEEDTHTDRDTDAGIGATDGPDRDGARRRYHVEPPVVRCSTAGLAVLADARRRLAEGADSPAAAVDAARSDTDGAGCEASPEATADLAAALRKHTRGAGVLADLFADGAVSDVFATSPVATTPLRVRVDDEPMTTNVRLTAAGAAALAARFRRASGRAFSRAAPTLDAATEIGGRRVRVAGVAGPVSDGHAFALRAHDRDVWRLADLVANGTVPPAAAGLLSVAVERGVACLVTGERGAGKTTLLGALCWELPATARTVFVEDTPELPAAPLREAGRDVQTLRVASGPAAGDGSGGDGSPGTGAAAGGAISASEALRAALRLGESALVVGEVRGEEARVLYEAMRVGAGGAAVLGTVHGEGAATVRDRVVDDLGVPASAFADTDLVVTVSARGTDRGRDRRVTRIEEVRNAPDAEGTDRRVAFAPLFERTADGLVPTDRLRDGSDLVTDLTPPDESDGGTLDAVAERARAFGAGDDPLNRERTGPTAFDPKPGGDGP